MKRGFARVEDPDPITSTPAGVQILSFFCGLVVALFGYKSARQDFISVDKLTHLERYVETPGKMLKVQVRSDSAGSKDDCYPDVLYEYFVEGKSIWGWRLSFEEEPKSRAYWQDRLARYSVGASVPVFYNPSNAKESILEKRHGGVFRTVLKMGLGAGFMLVGFLLAGLPLWSWIRKSFAVKK